MFLAMHPPNKQHRSQRQDSRLFRARLHNSESFVTPGYRSTLAVPIAWGLCPWRTG